MMMKLIYTLIFFLFCTPKQYLFIYQMRMLMKTTFTFLFFFLTLGLLPLQAQYQLNGSAIQTDENCFELTPAINNQAGSMWYLEQVSLFESFTLDFDIFLGCVDANGADGIYFVLQPISTSLGSAGGGIGFQGIVPSLGVEFDTWQNNSGAEAYADPTFDHVAIQQNGDLNHSGVNNLAGPVAISASSDNVEDCAYHNMRIVWQTETQTLSVYFDCNLRLTYTGNIVDDIFGGDPDVFWGFTSATGGANNVHAICLDYVSFTDQLQDTAICPGQSVPLSVPEGFELYIWEPTTGLDNPNIPNPVATPTETTTYTVTVIDECGTDFNDVVTISIVPELVLELGPDLFICENETVAVDATTAGATAYLWENGTTNPVFEVTAHGTYWVEVSNDCYSVTDTITFLPLVVDYNLDLGPDVTVCEGQAAALSSNILDDNLNFQWSNGQTTPAISVLEGGVYSLTISNDCGVSSDTIMVFLTPAPSVELGETLQDLCVENVNLLDATGNEITDYIWQDGSANATYLVEETGIYSVTVSNACGTATDEVCITLQSCDVQCEAMEIIHVFTCEPVTQNYSVFASVSGGTAPYSVSGSYNGVINEDNTVISFGPLTPGTNYQLTFTDAMGCVRSVLTKPFCNTLPVELLSFTGKTTDLGNELQWKVASETNCAHYTLYFSSEGAGNFRPLGQIQAAGTTSLNQQYDFLHAEAPSGKSYYQLSQTDFDGTEHFLGTVLLQRNLPAGVENLFAFTILPVPVKQEAWLNFSSPVSETVKVSLYNTAGQLVMDALILASEGNNQYVLQVNDLPSGLYVAMLSNSSSRSVQKLFKE